MVGAEKSLNLATNTLKVLPASISLLIKLKTLRLDSNRLEVGIHSLQPDSIFGKAAPGTSVLLHAGCACWQSSGFVCFLCAVFAL